MTNLAQNGINLALSEKNSLKKMQPVGFFPGTRPGHCQKPAALTHFPQRSREPEFCIPVRRVGFFDILIYGSDHSAFSRCTMVLPSSISALLWVTIITVFPVSCRITA